jgi:IclR family transcriptional regulator, acetate operon repressor
MHDTVTMQARTRDASVEAAAEDRESGHRGVARMVAILQMVAGAERALTLAEICNGLGVPKGTMHRLVQALVQEHMLAREPGGKRYHAGPRFTSMAVDALTHSSDRGARHAILQELVDTIGETCNFTMLDGGQIVYLDRVEAHWPLRLALLPGSHVPLHCTSSGKLFLAMMPPTQMRRYIRAAPLSRHTANTITDPVRLAAALREIRKTGVGTDDEEYLDGLNCLAVPVRSAHGKVCAAVAVHAPKARLDLARALTHLPAMRKAAAALSASLSGESATAKEAKPAAKQKRRQKSAGVR